MNPLPLLRHATALTSLVSALAAGAAEPPRAEVRDVVETLHGVSVHDPYRYFEDIKAPPVQDWLKGQAAYARTTLDHIALRAGLEARITELAAAAGDSVRGLVRVGTRVFYLKRARGERQYKLLVREGLAGAERLLVDPEVEAARTGVPHAINYFQPAWDGRTVAYGVSAGGSEDASLHLIDVASGRAIGEPVPRVAESHIAWLPDSRSLTFTQNKALGPHDPPTEFYMDARVLKLRVGDPASAAVPVFGPTVTPDAKLDRLDFATLTIVPGSRWVIARTTDTTVPEGKLFVAPLAQLGRPQLRWTRIAGPEDGIVSIALKGDRLYLQTHAGAPHHHIVALDLRHPRLADATEVVAQPASGVIEHFAPTRSGLVTLVRQGTSTVLRRHAAGDRVGRAMPMPFQGSSGLYADPAGTSDELLFAHEGWTEPARIFVLRGDRAEDTGLQRSVMPPGLPALKTTDVEVPSHDDARVPMTLLHRSDIVLDGRNPVLLNGYGAYGFSESAYWAPTQMAWLERGGVLAFANVRGSGVNGDDWYRAGFKQTKANTWLDGIACARWLIDQRWGSAATLAVMGGSAGGIFAGRVATTAPELFAAAVLNVGVMDTVRFEESANGVTNVSEYGSAKNATEFPALLGMSTYHAIRDGTAYPAVLLTHGMNDPRVDVWHSAKAAARLQAANPGGKPVLLRLDLEAGHGVGSTTNQRDALWADIYTFLLWQTGKSGTLP